MYVPFFDDNILAIVTYFAFCVNVAVFDTYSVYLYATLWFTGIFICNSSHSSIPDDLIITRKLCCRKMTAQCALYGALKMFMTYAHGYYSQHFSWAFVPIHPMNVPSKFEVRSFTRS